ncbi:NAD/NADP octopine/nopaline dehydrogenase family protein [Bacillus cereus group sp. MYBK30-1]|uniref:NAD/NADP octopine/nopaline dehydrogenase family protein n=1 Tax=unclassified Bacillus cereus group TaxID=2750818 RepID=UPI003F79DA0F
MKITIVGAGNGGTTLAADLSFKGHEVTLLKTSNKLHNKNFNYLLQNNGEIIFKDLDEINLVKINRVTTCFEEAFSNNPQLIILFIQTSYHEEIIKRIAPYLKDDQTILVEPGYLSTAFFKKYCGHLNLIIAEAESSPIDCRITAPGEVQVLFKNVRNPIGIYPRYRKEEGMLLLNQLDYNFTALDSVVEAALHNPNLIVHTVGAIMSIPRIEFSEGDYWMYREVFTPSVWNLVEKLDNEKLEILSALSLEPVPYVEACKFRNSIDLNIDAKAVFFDYAKNHSPSGPDVSNSRYITEDVPEGLVLLESLGKVLNVNTPVCSALIDIASGCLNSDFRKNGRTVDRLDKKIIMEILGVTTPV